MKNSAEESGTYKPPEELPDNSAGESHSDWRPYPIRERDFVCEQCKRPCEKEYQYFWRGKKICALCIRNNTKTGYTKEDIR
jgi:hypothetical protein